MLRVIDGSLHSKDAFLCCGLCGAEKSFADKMLRSHGDNSAKPGKCELLANVIAGSEFLVSICFIRARIERSLLRGVLPQFSNLVHAAPNGFRLLPLILSLCFVPLSLLPRVLFLTLCEC